jgi:proteasome lid subunit RPN8/RPN11
VTQTIRIGNYLLDAIAAHGRVEYPREACGFLTGTLAGHPNRFVPIPNRAAEPEKFYRMDDGGVLNAYKVMDDIHEDPTVVYHTHTRTGSTLSRTDICEAWNLHAIYLVCSMQRSQTQPTFQAWRIVDKPIALAENGEYEAEPGDVFKWEDEKPVMRRAAEPVAIDIIDEVHPDSPVHGLVEGNKVRIIWDSESGRRTTVATVGPRAEGGSSVRIYPERPGLSGPVIDIALSRIRAVGILSEGQSAATIRARASSFLLEAAMRLAACDTSGAKDAIARAGLLMPRIVPAPPASTRGYRTLRSTEK